MIKLCAFLGNYGKEYRLHRHNVAWLFLESMQIVQDMRWSQKFKGNFAQIELSKNKVYFLKPTTFMNASGESVIEAARFLRVSPEEILTIHDELEMPFGSFGYKYSGGLGGHNGLRSMEQHFGTRDFWRLRFGIGRPEHNDVAGYVLSPFDPDQLDTLKARIFPEAEKTFYELFMDGVEGFDVRYKKVTLAKN